MQESKLNLTPRKIVMPTSYELKTSRATLPYTVYRKMVAVNTYICIKKIGTVPYRTVPYSTGTVQYGTVGVKIEEKREYEIHENHGFAALLHIRLQSPTCI